MHGKKKKMMILTVLTAIGLLAFGTYASAHMGMGYGGGQGWGPGSGYGGCGYANNLSQEELSKLDKARSAFFEATKTLRQNIYQKRLELGSELAKQNPDPQKAAALQKQISDLRGQLSQKRLDFAFQLQKINPDFGRGFMGGGMMGPGYGMGHHGRMGQGMMMKRGYGMRSAMMGPRGGYGMGPGMMGPGMMGPGMMGPRGGYGMGPGMMGPGYGMRSGMMGPGMMGPGMMGPGGAGPGYPQQYRGSQSPLTEKDARQVAENYLASTRNPNLKLGKITDAGQAFEVQIVTKDNSLVDKLFVDKRSGWIRPAY